MQYHEWSGVAILVLVLFRVLWGFVGGAQARFSAFLTRTTEGCRLCALFLGKDAERYLGHNPLGGWSIIAMLVTLSIQVGTGSFCQR